MTRELALGDVLFHPAFGFATVEDVDDSGAALRWQRQGPSHPVHVSFAGLKKYRRCLPDGLLARSVRDLDAARTLVEQEPLSALALLIAEIEGPLEVADVRDWYLSMRLVSAARFELGWEALKPLLAADQRFTLSGNRLGLADGVDRARLLEVPPRPLLPPGTLLPASAFAVGIRLARALAEVHHAGNGIVADRASIQVVGDRILYAPRPGTSPSSRRDDVRFVARLLIEQVVGPLPGADRVADSELIAILGTLPASLPLELVAVVSDALAADPQLRPADGFALWERLHVAEAVATLRTHAPWAQKATLVAGFDTHIGTLKSLQAQTNQDTFLVVGDAAWSLAAVFDGISQCNAGSGDLASALTARALRTWWAEESESLRDAEPVRIFQGLNAALARANQIVCEAALRLARRADEDFIPMGTTAVIAVNRGNRVHLAALGDSRAYLLGRHGVSLLTWDQNLQSERLLDAVSGRGVDWRQPGSALVGYVGHYTEDGTIAPARTFTRTITLLPDEWLVLCSDGLTDYAGPEEAAVTRLLDDTVRRSDGVGAARAMDVCRNLVDAANRGGGGDNITVLALTLSADRAASPTAGSHPS